MRKDTADETCRAARRAGRQGDDDDDDDGKRGRRGHQTYRTTEHEDVHDREDHKNSPVLDSNLHFFPPAAANFLARQMARSSAHEFGADNGAACVGPERVLCRLVEKGRYVGRRSCQAARRSGVCCGAQCDIILRESRFTFHRIEWLS